MERKKQTEVRRPVRKLHFDCNLPGLLDEVLNNPTCAILKVPINITRTILGELAQLAIEIDDDRLHIMMLRLNLYDVPFDERVEKIKEIKDRLAKESEDDSAGGSEEIEDEPVPEMTPCPKCGANPRLVHPSFDGGSQAECRNCGFPIRGQIWAGTDAKAARLWNEFVKNYKDPSKELEKERNPNERE